MRKKEPPDLSDCLAPKEAAAELRRTVHTLKMWRVAGRGPKFLKNGSGKNSIWYKKDEIARYKREVIKDCASTAEGKI